MKRYRSILATVAVALFAASQALADRTFTGTGTSENSNALSARVVFSTSGSNLKVTLFNDAALPANIAGPGDVLTGLFFDLSGTNLTNQHLANSAVVSPNQPPPSGSTVANISFSTLSGNGNGADVSSEWGYRSDTPAYGRKYGLGASGLGNTFGKPDLLVNGNLSTQDNSPEGGADWGLIYQSYVDGSGNGGINKFPLIRNSVCFTLPGLPGGFNLNAATINVNFQYGTDLGEAHFAGSEFHPPVVPEPGTLTLLGMAIAPLAARRLRRRTA